MRPDIFLDEFETFDVIMFGKHTGFAIDHAQDALLLFFFTGQSWRHERYALDEIRDFSGAKVEYQPGVNFIVNNRGISGAAEALGQGLGSALSDAAGKRRAAEQTGITFRLRSVERPEFMLSISDDNRRTKIIEAVTQVLEGSKLSKPYQVLTPALRKTFQRPMPHILEREARKKAESEKPAEPISTKSALLFIAAALMGFLIIGFMSSI